MIAEANNPIYAALFPIKKATNAAIAMNSSGTEALKVSLPGQEDSRKCKRDEQSKSKDAFQEWLQWRSQKIHDISIQRLGVKFNPDWGVLTGAALSSPQSL